MLSDFLSEEVFKAGLKVRLFRWNLSGSPSLVLSLAQQDCLRPGDMSHSRTENTQLPVSGVLLQGTTGREL